MSIDMICLGEFFVFIFCTVAASNGFMLFK